MAAAALVDNPAAWRDVIGDKTEADSTGQVTFLERLVHPKDASAMLDEMTTVSNVSLANEEVKRGGKTFVMGRKTAHFGDTGVSYRYAGKRRDAKTWANSRLGRVCEEVLAEVERATGEKFNYCLVTEYRPQDGLGFHADDETDLEPGSSIAGVSFGATRDVVFHKNGKGGAKKILALPSGSLFVMKGALQKHWKHSIPARKRALGKRISLTFRRMVDTSKGVQKRGV